MKKLLSLSLAVLMLCSLFTVNAFAATETVIGGPRDNEATDGVTTFTDKAVTGDVSVQVTTVTHKYSVDITYSNMVYSLPSLTWDPSALEYVAAGGNITTDVTITLKNYSDLPVYATATFADDAGNDPSKGFGFAFEGAYTDVTIPAATIGDASDDVIITGGLTGADTAEKIANAVLYYEGKGSGAIKIGTYTVTISMNT